MNALRRFGLRFGLIYAVLYVLPFPFTLAPLPHYLPGIRTLEAGCEKIWDVLVPWISQAVFHLDQPVVHVLNGSGDTIFHYLKAAILVAMAAVSGLIWSVFDRSHRRDRILAELLRVELRYYLAATLGGYGLAKFWHQQFPYALPEYLIERYGDSSPMRLLWAFMGYSTGYSIFTGMAEALAGVLLLFRRTATLGALVGLVVMANVVALNFCYDVPAKLFSCHLLAFAVILTWADRHRLAAVFLLNHATAPVPLAPPWHSRWIKLCGLVLKTAMMGGFIYVALGDQMHVTLKPATESVARIRLTGVFDVVDFIQNDIPIRASLATKRWQVVTFTPLFESIGVHLSDDGNIFYHGVIDAAEGTLTLTTTGPTFKNPNVSPITPIIFKYTCHLQDELTLEGNLNGNHVVLRLHRSDLLLLSRKFHWISEAPFNR